MSFAELDSQMLSKHSPFLLRLDPEGLQLSLIHSGSNGGKLDWIKVESWLQGVGYFCKIRAKLDYYDSFLTTCEYFENEIVTDSSLSLCNGRPEFCDLKIDQFLWPGSHNSGTGQQRGSLSCAFKNQDLNIVEQLEFGIRAFDLDVIFSHDLKGCQGLETGTDS